tara:strand:- start:259 stop:630 length:372 start_codon:yes stop_codon:yes gene_type:complete
MAIDYLSSKVKLYCASKGVSSVNFTKDVLLQDDGDGSYIKEWNLDIDKPTDATLNKFDGQSSRRMSILRNQRDKLLKETDWLALSDVTMSDDWKTYRQSLRDITTQTPSDDSLSNITFPTKPS